MPSTASPPGPQSDEPFYLRVIDLFARVAMGYFAIVGAALAIALARGDERTFRSWTSFAIQSCAVFVVGAIVAQRTLAEWRKGGRAFVPANISSSAAIVGVALAAGTLAGGFFPDAIGYQRRAPEPFWRTLSALVPLAIAVYVVLRSAERSTPVAAAPSEPPFTGEARDAAIRALEILDRGDQAIADFQQQVAAGRVISRAHADGLWARLDGNGYVAYLRQMPPEHTITRSLRDAAVAQTDAVYLIGLTHSAHDALGHTSESARAFISEVANRRGRPGADAETLAAVARGACKEHREAAAGLLHARISNTDSTTN